MKFISSTKMNNAPFFKAMSFDEFDAEIEMPGGNDPAENAALSVTVNYSLNFVDSKNRVGNLISDVDGKACIKTSTGVLPLNDWTPEAKIDFQKCFQKSGNVWNRKFLLITPKDFNAFDFTTKTGAGWICRPNVLCLFKLNNGGTPNHLSLNVVRSRSDVVQMNQAPEGGSSLWQDLRHSLAQSNIKTIPGNKMCLVDTSGQGGGQESSTPLSLTPQNAQAWLELISRFTETPQSKWRLSIAANMAPRKMPVGFVIRGVMPTIW